MIGRRVINVSKNVYSLRPGLIEQFAHFTRIKKKYINEGERKMVLSAIVKY